MGAPGRTIKNVLPKRDDVRSLLSPAFASKRGEGQERCARRVPSSFLEKGKPCSAFTLIEMVISAALMALVLGASYICLNAAIAGKKLIEPRADVLQNARVAMAMISADLHSACPLSKDFEFLGMHRMIEDIQADNVDFATHNYMPRRSREADYCQLSYFVEKEENSNDVSLYRRRNPTIAPDPLSGGSREVIARGLRGVSFEYYDGWDWYDTWGELNPEKKERKSSLLAANLSGMPEAVRITLWFNPNPRSVPRKNSSGPNEPEHSESALMFETTVRLNLAAASQSGFSGRSSNTTGQTQEGQSQDSAPGQSQ
jgi:prepilin-type N-terminal cleavage/methylation domain-containing protein